MVQVVLCGAGGAMWYGWFRAVPGGAMWYGWFPVVVLCGASLY